MPPLRTVMRWLDARPAFCQQYARAKAIGLEAMAEDILHIANNPIWGKTTTVKPDGGIEEKTGDMIEHRRLQVDARKWLLSKLAPKKYGDKIAAEISGVDGGPIMTASAPQLTREEWLQQHGMGSAARPAE